MMAAGCPGQLSRNLAQKDSECGGQRALGTNHLLVGGTALGKLRHEASMPSCCPLQAGSGGH